MPVECVDIAGATVEVAVPARPARVAGVSMAGFRGGAPHPVDMQLVPYPALTVFLDLGGDLLLTSEPAGARVRGCGVLGMAASRVHGSGREIDLLQIRLSPVVAHAVLGGAADVDQTVVAFEDLWGREADHLVHRLRGAASWDERFAIAETALARRLEPGRAIHPELAHAWGRIVRSRGQIRVEQVAAELGWSRKRLWSRFGAQLGLTPKRAAQLVRFDHAAHRLAAGHSAADVSADSGYVDQSHLCRDAMIFAGLTPAALAVAPWLTVDPIAWSAPAYTHRP